MLSILHPFAKSRIVTNDGMKIELQESGSEFDAILHIFGKLPEYDRPGRKTFSKKIARFFITIFFIGHPRFTANKKCEAVPLPGSGGAARSKGNQAYPQAQTN
jgi:hypothetical protein